MRWNHPNAASQSHRKIAYLVLHCTAGNPDATWKDLQHFFLTPKAQGGRGCKKGGYHIIIEKNGAIRRIYEDTERTNGVLSFRGISNSNAIHVAYTGGRVAGEISKAQLDSIEQILRYFVETYPNIKILGHNQIAEKYCPHMNVTLLATKMGLAKDNIYNRHHFPRFSDKKLPKSVEKMLFRDLAHYRTTHIRKP